MILPALLAVVLAGAPDPAPQAHATPADATPAADTADAEETTPPEAPPAHSGPRHALAVGWHGTTFVSDEGSQYTFHSASLGYHGSFGARGPFVQVIGLLPLQARQDGRIFATADYYRRRAGGDLLAGWQWRWTAFPGVEAEAGPGLHADFLWLPGKAGYRDFSAFPIGVGGAGVLRWRPGARAFSRPVVLGAYGSAALDLWDPAHANDIAHGFAFRLGVAVGVGEGS